MRWFILAKDKSPTYGGQAVVEGVMFGGKKVYVTAIRRKNQRIEYYEVPNNEGKIIKNLKKVPLLRGSVALIMSAANGTKHLNFSTERFEIDPDETIEEEQKDNTWGKIGMVLGVAVVGVLSLLFGKILFTALPAFLAEFFFGELVPDHFYNILVEGVIKITILLLYIFAIAQAPFIKRLFQYHGAEHKVINTFEAGEELTVDNVKKYSRFHYRCGSSFTILTVIIGILIYSLFNAYVKDYNSIVERILQRVALIPLVIGVSYEALKFTNLVRDYPILKWLGYPGIWLQLLTTKEPDGDQIEVSISAFNRMRELDQAKDNVIQYEAGNLVLDW